MITKKLSLIENKESEPNNNGRRRFIKLISFGIAAWTLSSYTSRFESIDTEDSLIMEDGSPLLLCGNERLLH